MTIHPVLALLLHLATVASVRAQEITTAGQPAQLDIRAAGEHSIRVTLKPIAFAGDFPLTPAVTERSYPASAVSLRDITAPATAKVGTCRSEQTGTDQCHVLCEVHPLVQALLGILFRPERMHLG